MSLRDDSLAYEKRLLSLPLSRSVSGEDEEHGRDDQSYVVIPAADPSRVQCGCDRCRIIRIKKMRAFRFSQTKCKCGNLFVSAFFNQCSRCRGEAK